MTTRADPRGPTPVKPKNPNDPGYKKALEEHNDRLRTQYIEEFKKALPLIKETIEEFNRQINPIVNDHGPNCPLHVHADGNSPLGPNQSVSPINYGGLDCSTLTPVHQKPVQVTVNLPEQSSQKRWALLIVTNCSNGGSPPNVSSEGIPAATMPNGDVVALVSPRQTGTLKIDNATFNVGAAPTAEMPAIQLYKGGR